MCQRNEPKFIHYPPSLRLPHLKGKYLPRLQDSKALWKLGRYVRSVSVRGWRSCRAGGRVVVIAVNKMIG